MNNILLMKIRSMTDIMIIYKKPTSTDSFLSALKHCSMQPFRNCGSYSLQTETPATVIKIWIPSHIGGMGIEIADNSVR